MVEEVEVELVVLEEMDQVQLEEMVEQEQHLQ